MVAENLNRKWVCIELSESYLRGSIGRFQEPRTDAAIDKAVQYSINTPCALPPEGAEIPLDEDGGKARPTTQSDKFGARTKKAAA